jgi:hypothetical protein
VRVRVRVRVRVVKALGESDKAGARARMDIREKKLQSSQSPSDNRKFYPIFPTSRFSGFRTG